MICKQCKRPIDQRKPFVGIPVRTHTGQTGLFHYHTGCYQGEISKCRPMGRYTKNLTRDEPSTWRQKRTAWGQETRALPFSKRMAMKLKGELPITNPKIDWLTCSRCGKVDKSVPGNVGTSVKMQCPDCGNPYAKFCRKCCPTGHQTKFSETNPVDYIDRIQKEEWPKKTKYKPTSKAIVPYWRGKKSYLKNSDDWACPKCGSTAMVQATTIDKRSSPSAVICSDCGWKGDEDDMVAQNPSRLDPWDKMERVRDHEIHRMRTMSKSALYTRIGKMNRPEKLRMFIQIARERNQVELAREAMARLRELGYRSNPRKYKKKPHHQRCKVCGAKVLPERGHYAKLPRRMICMGCGRLERLCKCARKNPIAETILASIAAGAASGAAFAGMNRAFGKAQSNPGGFTITKPILGLKPGRYRVVSKYIDQAHSGHKGKFSSTIVEDEQGNRFSIPTGNAQLFGLIEENPNENHPVHCTKCGWRGKYKFGPLKQCPSCGGNVVWTFTGYTIPHKISKQNPRRYHHNPLTKQEIDELESLRDAYLDEMDEIDLKDVSRPEELRRHYYLRGKVEAINQIINVYDGKMNEPQEMGKWAGHKANPCPACGYSKSYVRDGKRYCDDCGKPWGKKDYKKYKEAEDDKFRKRFGLAKNNPYYGHCPQCGHVRTTKDGKRQLTSYWGPKTVTPCKDCKNWLKGILWGYGKNPSRQFYGRSEIFGPTCPKCKTPRMRSESTYSGQKYTCAKCGHSFDSYHPNPQKRKGRCSTMETNPRRVRGVPTIRAAELISGLSPGFLYLVQHVIKNYKPGQYGQYQLWPTDMGVEVRDKISHKILFFIHYRLSERIDEVLEDFETRYSYHSPKIVYARALLHKFEPSLEPLDIVQYKDITIPQKKEHVLKARNTYAFWIEKKKGIPWTQYLLLPREEQAKLEYEFDRVLHLRRYRPEKKVRNYIIEKTDRYAIGISILPGKMCRGWIGNEVGIKYSQSYRFVEQALEWIERQGYKIPEKAKRLLKRDLPEVPVLKSQPDIPMPKSKGAELKTFEPIEERAAEEGIQKAQQNPSAPMPSQKEVEVAVAKAEEFHDMPPKGLKRIKVPNLKGVLVKLGIWPSTTYFSPKWKKKNQTFAGKEGQLYIHEWGDSQSQQKKRVVAFKPDKRNPHKGWIVAWGRGRLTPHGIEDLKPSK